MLLRLERISDKKSKAFPKAISTFSVKKIKSIPGTICSFVFFSENHIKLFRTKSQMCFDDASSGQSFPRKVCTFSNKNIDLFGEKHHFFSVIIPGMSLIFSLFVFVLASPRQDVREGLVAPERLVVMTSTELMSKDKREAMDKAVSDRTEARM